MEGMNMITSLSIKVEVNSGSHINGVAKDAVELCKKLNCGLLLEFDRCEVMVVYDTTEQEIIDEFKEY
jgi:hypothetical protein